MKKVLFVEDNTQLQELYKEILKKEDFTTIFTDNATQALQLIHKELPDLIMLDIMIPGGMNGFDILETIKRDEKLKNISVIVFTNLDSERETAMSIDATYYLVKVST